MNLTYQNIILHYETYGDKKEVIVILPGWGETKKSWECLIDILRLDYTVYFIDYPGFGKSPIPKKTLTMFDYAELIQYFLEVNKRKKPNVIAHSFGGRIAILLSSKYGIYMQKLILIDSAGIKPRKTLKSRFCQFSYKFLQGLADFLPKKIRTKVKTYLFQKFSSTDYLNLKEEMRETFKNIVNLDLTPYLPYVQNKTLLLWGEYDQDTPLKDGIKMNKKIRESELIVFPRCSHFCYLENPYVILKIILSFLEE